MWRTGRNTWMQFSQSFIGWPSVHECLLCIWSFVLSVILGATWAFHWSRLVALALLPASSHDWKTKGVHFVSWNVFISFRSLNMWIVPDITSIAVLFGGARIWSEDCSNFYNFIVMLKTCRYLPFYPTISALRLIFFPFFDLMDRLVWLFPIRPTDHIPPVYCLLALLHPVCLFPRAPLTLKAKDLLL